MVLTLPTHLSASTKPYVQETILYHTSGIPNEQAWDAYQEAVKARQRKGYEFNTCSCVSYARYATGINVGPIGLAKNHPVNSSSPVVGGLVITYESWTGHMGVVTELKEQTFRMQEYNYFPCQYSERELPYNYKLIKGFYNP